MDAMDVGAGAGASQNSSKCAKRTFTDVLRDLTRDPTPNAKRHNIESPQTDIIRVEVSKVIYNVTQLMLMYFVVAKNSHEILA